MCQGRSGSGPTGERNQMSTTTMTERVFNFSSGPAVLPEPVLREVQRDLYR